MDLNEKLKILSTAAKYDVSCSSSGSKRNDTMSGICHSFTPDGRCISLLKILLTNYCVYDCSYCINRCSNEIPRAAFTPNEVVELTMNFYNRNYIEGLFLSSAVFKNPNYTMELLIETLFLLRNTYKFKGYIHVKAIPGADEILIRRAGLLADRMSVNIELPSSSSLKLLAPQKHKDNILKPMGVINNYITEYSNDNKALRSSSLFVPGGQSTQLIVGATPESDLKILKLSESLYKKYELKRVYYSGYVPVNKDSKLPYLTVPPTTREHRLYQSDWLIRLYGFSAKEILNDENPNLDLNLDPKANWALNNINLFPIEINKASYETLLRIPGIGFRSAKRIIAARRLSSLNFDNLKTLGVVMKRAKFFITCKGKFYGDSSLDSNIIKQKLLDKKIPNKDIQGEQLSFFDTPMLSPSDVFSKIHGEI